MAESPKHTSTPPAGTTRHTAGITTTESTTGRRPTAGAPPGQPAAVEVVNVSKSYGAVRALRGVSLRVDRGEIHGLCGHNGAGKSTLVKALVGLVSPDSGEVRVGG